MRVESGRFDHLLRTAYTGPTEPCKCPHCTPSLGVFSRRSRTWHGRMIQTPEWDLAQACDRFGITWTDEGPFDPLDTWMERDADYVQGAAATHLRSGERILWINPAASEPVKTATHELTHILLEHTLERTQATTGDDERETEAEASAMLVVDALGIEGVGAARSYLKRWRPDGWIAIPDYNAARIKKAATEILGAGMLRMAA
jgi:hypothetical protein